MAEQGLLQEAYVQTSNIFIPLFIVFLLLGAAVIFGFGKQVTYILSKGFGGLMQVFRIARFTKILTKKIVVGIEKAILAILPFLAFFFVLSLYLVLMFLYKYVGQHSDVTLLTVILTILLTAAVKVFASRKAFAEAQYFIDVFKKRLFKYLLDYFEIMLFVFFLTMDIESPLFLPQSLWGELSAKISGYDLMIRGFDIYHEVSFTLWLAGLAFFVEFVRQAYKVYQNARIKYLELKETAEGISKLDLFELAITQSFNESLSNLVLFFGYTSVVFITFFAFPRLKILSLIVFSLTSFLFDIVLSNKYARPTEARQEDFLTRVITKTLNIRHEGNSEALAVRTAAKIRNVLSSLINDTRRKMLI